MYIGKRIAKLRKEHQMQQDELCTGLFSRSHMSNIESGRYSPGKKLLMRIADKLGVPEAYLTQYNQEDEQLTALLHEYASALDTFEIDQAEQLRLQISEQHPFISSVVQETYFFLLESCYWVKKSKVQLAEKIFTKEFIPLINESRIDTIPAYMQEKYYYMKAIIAYQQQAFVEACQYFSRQHTLVTNDYQQAVTCYNLANVYYRLNDLSNAREYARSSYDLYATLFLWKQAVDALVLLGITYWEYGSYDKAENKLHLALELLNEHVTPQANNSLARIYHNLGLVYKDRGHPETAIELLNQSIRLKIELGEPSLFLTYLTLVNTFIQVNLLGKAQSALMEAEACLPKKDRYSNALFMLTKARVHLNSGQQTAYEALMKESIKILHSLLCWKELLKAAEELGDFYQRSRKYKQAADYYKLSIDASKYLNAHEKQISIKTTKMKPPTVNVADGPAIHALERG